ncbi:Cyclohexanone monooxygenase [Actinomycetales bacterium JB111]|nr:Cyclohexanone monooxygenase [Actinomycetales bacterium JB111]
MPVSASIHPSHRTHDPGVPMELSGDIASSISASDSELRKILEDAELIPLLAALSHCTGDLSLVADHLRPTGPTTGAVPPLQGGLTPAEQDSAKEAALRGLARLRSGTCTELDLSSEKAVKPLFDFITGPGAEEYVPLLRHELGYPRDLAEPAWDAATLAPGRTLRAVVIGAGLSGLVAAHRLHQAGVDVAVVDKNAEVGGTWYENTYPGCRLDTTNFGYSYTFAQTSRWPNQYSPQRSIHGYLRTVADTTGIREHVRSSTTVTALTYDEKSSVWSIDLIGPTGSPERLDAEMVVSAVGQLNQPNVPTIPGADTFAGESWHTARWRHDIPLEGKKIAVIGTGASAFQVIPEVAKSAAEVTVYQRTPPWLLPAPDYRSPIADGMQWLLEHVPHFHRWYRLYQFWTTVEGRRDYVDVDPEWTHPVSVSRNNDELRSVLTDYLETQFAGAPEMLDSVVPTYPPGAKRMLRDDGTWATTLMREDVHLVTDGIDHIEADGIVTTDGARHEADVIIYGTGFHASEFLRTLKVTGRGGQDLHDYWSGDARAYVGATIPGFPNLFCMWGPNTNLVVNGSILQYSEISSTLLVKAAHTLLDGAQEIEVKKDVFDTFNERLDAANRMRAWGASDVSSWYKNASGRVSQNWPFSTLEFWNLTRSIDEESYDIR